jgi:hypothetical protein
MQTIDIQHFKAGKWVQRFEYKSFTPNLVCVQWLITLPEIQ